MIHAVDRVLGPVVDAARDKVESMLRSSAGPEEELRRLAQPALGADVVERVLELARSLGKTGAPSGHDAYLSHPFRVARVAMTLRDGPDARTFTVGTLHNVYEIGNVGEAHLVERGVAPDDAAAIRLLTIDRSRETDPSYLRAFYGAIEAHSEWLALVRTVDKLDNVLGLQLLAEGPVKTSYIDLAERFVGPMARALDARLGAYFAEAIAFARATPSDPARIADYERRTRA